MGNPWALQSSDRSNVLRWKWVVLFKSLPNLGTEPLIGSKQNKISFKYLKDGMGNPWALQSSDMSEEPLWK